MLWNFISEESAATSIEYALIGGVISIAILAAVTDLATNLAGRYDAIKTALTS